MNIYAFYAKEIDTSGSVTMTAKHGFKDVKLDIPLVSNSNSSFLYKLASRSMIKVGNFL